MRNKLLHKVVSGLLTLSLAFSLASGYSLPVKAYETDVSDGSVSGTGSEQSAKGQWTTHTVEHTIYRVYPIVIPNPDTLKGDYQIPTSYYYTFRDLALYTTEAPEDKKAFYFTGSTTRAANTIESMTLNSNGSFDFSALGIDLNLPKHTFTTTASKYISFSEELRKKIRTSGEDANIQEIFTNYMNLMESRYGGLSAKAKAKFDTLKSVIGWGTAYFDDYCKNVGLVFEVCSEATNKGGSRYLFSWQDLNESKVKNDAYYIWKVFDMAEKSGDLLSWNAVYEATGIKLSSAYNGLATFLLMNSVPTNTGSAYSQGINITLNYNGEVKSGMSIKDGVEAEFGITTTAVSDKLKVKLGDVSYKNTLTDAFTNSSSGLPKAGLISSSKNFTSSLLGSEGSTKSNNKLGISGSSDTEYTLNACGDKSTFGDTSLIGYDTIEIPIAADTLKLSSLYDLSGDIRSILSNVTAKTNVQVVPNGWGSTYSLKFQSGDTTTRQSLANTISSKYSGVGTVKSFSSKTNAGTLDTLANLQGATLLAGRVKGDMGENGDVAKASGTIYASIAYLAKTTNITSKEAEVSVDQNFSIQSSSGIDSKTYSSSSIASWGIKKSGETYVLAWRAKDYDLTDENALTLAILNNIGSSFSGESGAVQISNAFRAVTGVNPLGAKYLRGDENVAVGAVANEDGSLSGINVLVLKLSGGTINNTPVGDDLVDSNELNMIYPNLLGNHADVSSILSMAENVPDIKYNYSVSDSISGDLWSFKGSKVHYYYPVTGLFGVSSKSNKSFGSTSYPSYAYNISRGLWGDTVVASNYRGLSAEDESIKKEITDDLGLSVGTVGLLSPVTCGVNVDATYSEGRKDKYTFTGTINREWYTSETDEDGNSYQKRHTDTVSQTNSYSLSHSLNKYTCLTMGTALNSKAGSTGYMVQGKQGVSNKVTVVTQSPKTVTVYPEVLYKYYRPSVSTGVLSGVKPLNIYCMGERGRTMKPTAFRGINMKYSDNSQVVAEGEITSDTMPIGTDAYKLSKSLPTIVQGGNLNLLVKSLVDYELISYSLDVVEKYNGVSVRSLFSTDNKLYEPEKDHQSYVDAFSDQVYADVNLIFENNQIRKEYDNFSGGITYPKVIKDTVTTEIPLEFEYGHLTTATKEAVLQDMMKSYNISHDEAVRMFESTGIEKQLQDMFESSNDANNKSKNHWYDEKSVTIVLRKYLTTLDIGQYMTNDKIDFSILGVKGLDGVGNVIHDSAGGKFYLTVKLPDNFKVDGYQVDLKGKNLLIDKQLIRGSEFVLVSMSTADFNR